MTADLQPTVFKFWKMHGCGNHFVVAEILRDQLNLVDERFAKTICSAHFGVGADGIMIIHDATESWADYDVTMRNPDGSLMGMCGNGIRCVAEYLKARHLSCPDDLVFNIEGKKITTSWSASGIEVVMDTPSHCEEVQVETNDKKRYDIVSLTIPNPHAVLFVDCLPDSSELARLGSELERHKQFPQRTNVEFVVINSPSEISVSIWERGAGATLACGTGACAAVVAGISRGFLARKCRVHLPGGDVTVEWKNEETPVILEGPAAKVFEGEYHYAI